MKYYVPDSIANKVYEREIDPAHIAGLRPLVACVVVNAIDLGERTHKIDGDNYYILANQSNNMDQFTYDGGVAALTYGDGRDHHYGIVLPLDATPEVAKAKAEAILAGWNE